jgi:hypothetical protein
MARATGHRDYEAIGRKEIVLDPPKGIIVHKYLDARDNDWFPEMGIVGGYATAKSTMLLDFLIRRALDYPGSNILLARATLTSLKASTLTKLTQRLGAVFESENEHEAIYRLPEDYNPMTGQKVQSIIKGIGLDRANLEQVFKSTEYHTGGIEEGDEVDGDSHDILQARLRQVCFHRTLKVYDLAMFRAQQWGVTPEEAYEIMYADKRHAVGQHDLAWDDPMPGPTVLKTVWNPPGGHIWDRYVGIPHPDGIPTPSWVDANVGIREKHVEPARLIEEQFHFRAGSMVKLSDGSRRYAAKEDGQKVKLIGGGEVPRTEAGLIVQRACIYIFKDENESRNFENDENSYLMENRDLRRRAFLGEGNARMGRVFPNYVDDYVENGGNLLRWPGRDRLAQAQYRGFGGIDQGGRHATAMVVGVITPQTGVALLYDEYVRVGVAARDSAYDALGLVLPGSPDFWWAYDPAMDSKRYDKDLDYSTSQEYRAVLMNMMPGDRGKAAFDYVNGLLSVSDTLIGEKPTSKLLIFDHLVQVRETLLKLTWKMVDSQRDNWMVDLGDAIKIAMTGYRQMQTFSSTGGEPKVIIGPPSYGGVRRDSRPAEADAGVILQDSGRKGYGITPGKVLN